MRRHAHESDAFEKSASPRCAYLRGSAFLNWKPAFPSMLCSLSTQWECRNIAFCVMAWHKNVHGTKLLYHWEFVTEALYLPVLSPQFCRAVSFSCRSVVKEMLCFQQKQKEPPCEQRSELSFRINYGHLNSDSPCIYRGHFTAREIVLQGEAYLRRR